MNKYFTLRDLTQQVMVATIYVVLVLSFAFMSYQDIQFRVAEALLVLVFFNKKHIYGLAIGTFIANSFSPFGLIDAFVGTAATLVAIIPMSFLGKNKTSAIIALILPVLSNAFIIGALIAHMEGQWQLYFEFALSVGLGQFAVLYTLGVILYLSIHKNNYLHELLSSEQ